MSSLTLAGSFENPSSHCCRRYGFHKITASKIPNGWSSILLPPPKYGILSHLQSVSTTPKGETCSLIASGNPSVDATMFILRDKLYIVERNDQYGDRMIFDYIV